MRHILLALLISLGAFPSMAGPMTPAARAEVDGLLARLEASGCEFQRNGTWHKGADARSHLAVKLKYLEERDAVNSAEQFIERAASRSSLTGQAYLVRCANSAPVSSSSWLLSQLQRIRDNPATRSRP